MLTTIHNLHYYLNLMREVREALDAGTFSQFRAQFKADRARGVKPGPGTWAPIPLGSNARPRNHNAAAGVHPLEHAAVTVSPSPVSPVPPASPAMHVLVTGGTGFIGTALKRPAAAGRRPQRHGAQPQARQRPGLVPGARSGSAQCQRPAFRCRFDAIVNLAGAPWWARRGRLGGGKCCWTAAWASPESLLAWLQRATHRPAVWVQASAIGFMACAPARSADQKPVPQAAASCPNCACAGKRLRPGPGAGRAPGGAAPGRGAGPRRRIAALLLPIRLGVGGRMGSGQRVMSWIHRDDVLALIHAALRDPQMGASTTPPPRDHCRPPLWPPLANCYAARVAAGAPRRCAGPWAKWPSCLWTGKTWCLRACSSRALPSSTPRWSRRCAIWCSAWAWILLCKT